MEPSTALIAFLDGCTQTVNEAVDGSLVLECRLQSSYVVGEVVVAEQCRDPARKVVVAAMVGQYSG